MIRDQNKDPKKTQKKDKAAKNKSKETAVEKVIQQKDVLKELKNIPTDDPTNIRDKLKGL